MNRVPVIERLRELGWNVAEKRVHCFRLPSAVESRYPRLPDSLVQFLSSLTKCVDGAGTTWFLTQDDFDGSSDAAFSWDEWEQVSLDAAGDDVALINEIRAFWKCHFPFLFSVSSGYAYHAICTENDRFGCVVSGSEPDFEDATLVADSFENFLTMLLDAKTTS